MANHKSAETRKRHNEKRAKINGARKSRIRTLVKKVELALSSGDSVAAKEAFKAAQPEMMRGVTKGVFHKNTMSRKVSRLSQRLKSLSA